MSVSSTDKGLLTPDNCAVIFIDHQPELLTGVANGDRLHLLDNLQLLAKAARIFSVPVILTAVESKGFSGEIAPPLLELFPDQKPIERSSMNAWDNPASWRRSRVRGEGTFCWRRCGARRVWCARRCRCWRRAMAFMPSRTRRVVRPPRLRRRRSGARAGGRGFTHGLAGVLLEFQRDWARTEHNEEVMAYL